jgi:hypothetical protein
METIKELSSLSVELNKPSDKINSIISTINSKLANLNLGVETWLESTPIDNHDFQNVYPNQLGQLPQQKSVTYLGYCRIGDGWQLVTKRGRLVRDFDSDAGETTEEFIDVSYRALLKESREIRTGALRLVPKLLDEVKKRAESLLDFIKEAEQAAAKL